MILCHIDDVSQYETLNSGFKFAFDYLKNLKASDIENVSGQRLQGNQIFLNQGVLQAEPVSENEVTVMESHQKYIDVQYVLKGQNRMGWTPLNALQGKGNGYHPLEDDLDGDYELYDAVPQTWFATPPGTIAIFFPEDVHIPLNGNEEIVKVVIKVAVND